MLKNNLVLRQCRRNLDFHFCGKIFHKIRNFCFLDLKFFWSNKSNFVVQKNFGFEKKPKMTKKIALENLKTWKKCLFGHFVDLKFLTTFSLTLYIKNFVIFVLWLKIFVYILAKGIKVSSRSCLIFKTWRFTFINLFLSKKNLTEVSWISRFRRHCLKTTVVSLPVYPN